MDDQSELRERIARLEREVAELRARALLRPLTPEKPAAPAAPPPRPAPPPRTAKSLEADLGVWLARVGAVAFLIGAGFAFKYAVDRGLIGPLGRVVTGVLVGGWFLAGAEWSRTKGWRAFAQALAGLAIALEYLSVLAASELYNLIPGSVALFLLTGITVACAAIAMRYDAPALAVLATVGGLVNALLIGADRDDPALVLAYLVALDAGVLVLALERWRLLDAVAAGGTLIVFVVHGGDATFLQAFGFATILAIQFAVAPFARALTRRPVGREDLVVPLAASFAYFAYVLELLERHGHEDWQGAFAVVLGVVWLGLGLVAWRSLHDDLLAAASIGAGAVFLGLAVPIQLDGPVVATVWTAQGALLAGLGAFFRERRWAYGGLGLLGLAFVWSLSMLSEGYDPSRTFVSPDALAVVLQVALLGAAAALLARGADAEVSKTAWAVAAAGTLLFAWWVSAETAESIRRSLPPGDARSAVQFAISAIWGLFGAGLIVSGVAFRARWLRIEGLVVLGLVVVKLALSDLWLLPTSYRVLAFMGMGAVLLTCSLLYQRFRELVLSE